MGRYLPIAVLLYVIASLAVDQAFGVVDHNVDNPATLPNNVEPRHTSHSKSL